MSRSCLRENSRNSAAGLKRRRPPPGDPSEPPALPAGLPGGSAPGAGPGPGADPGPCSASCRLCCSVSPSCIPKRRPSLSASSSAAMVPGWPPRSLPAPLRPAPPRSPTPPALRGPPPGWGKAAAVLRSSASSPRTTLVPTLRGAGMEGGDIWGRLDPPQTCPGCPRAACDTPQSSGLAPMLSHILYLWLLVPLGSPAQHYVPPPVSPVPISAPLVPPRCSPGKPMGVPREKSVWQGNHTPATHLTGAHQAVFTPPQTTPCAVVQVLQDFQSP